jgi:hypothetical protein
VPVVDQAQQRPVPGRLRQQGEGGHGHQEPVGRRPRLQADGDPQGLGLRAREPVGPAQQGVQQLLEGGEGQPRLALHPGRVQHPQAAGPPAGVGEQGRLADPRLPPDGQRPAAAGPGGRQQPVDHGQLGRPAVQHRPGREPGPGGVVAGG